MTLSHVEKLEQDVRSAFDEAAAIMAETRIIYSNPNDGSYGVFFIDAQRYHWAPESPGQEVRRMEVAQRLQRVHTSVQLLFPHATPNIQKLLDRAFGVVGRWMNHVDDKGIPPSGEQGQQYLQESCDKVLELLRAMPSDDKKLRLVVDTNAMIDNPDLACYRSELGDRYWVHIPTVTLRELDDIKRSGRHQQLRDAAAAAGRRLKMLRTNGDPLQGVRVAGDIWAQFDYAEPTSDLLPHWLDLSIPDDRFAAAVLMIQSAHPGSICYAATSDINLQTKLAALGLPFIEPPPA